MATDFKIPAQVEKRTKEFLEEHAPLQKCPRCLGFHPEMFWNRFKLANVIYLSSIEIYSMAYALCPKTDEPVIFSVQFRSE